MSTQVNFEKLMRLRDARERAGERYDKACVRYYTAVEKLGFSDIRNPKLFQYKGKSYVVKAAQSYINDRVLIEEVET